jgi:hypothetical protein
MKSEKKSNAPPILYVNKCPKDHTFERQDQTENNWIKKGLAFERALLLAALPASKVMVSASKRTLDQKARQRYSAAGPSPFRNLVLDACLLLALTSQAFAGNFYKVSSHVVCVSEYAAPVRWSHQAQF